MKKALFIISLLIFGGIVMAAQNYRAVRLKRFVDRELEKVLSPMKVALEK